MSGTETPLFGEVPQEAETKQETTITITNIEPVQNSMENDNTNQHQIIEIDDSILNQPADMSSTEKPFEDVAIINVTEVGKWNKQIISYCT